MTARLPDPPPQVAEVAVPGEPNPIELVMKARALLRTLPPRGSSDQVAVHLAGWLAGAWRFGYWTGTHSSAPAPTRVNGHGVHVYEVD